METTKTTLKEKTKAAKPKKKTATQTQKKQVTAAQAGRSLLAALKHAGKWLWKHAKQMGTWLWNCVKQTVLWLGRRSKQAAVWLWDSQKRKRVTIGLLILAAFILSFFGGTALRTEITYQSGVALYEKEDYEAAAVAFQKTPSYKDAEDYHAKCRQYIIYAQAQLLMENGAYKNALALFASLGEFEQAIPMAERCSDFILYENALILMEYGAYDQANQLFFSLAGFEDAQMLATQCRYAYGQQLFDNGAFEEAYNVFKGLGNTAKASLSLYYYAQTLFETGNYWEAYARFSALNDYKDAAEKAQLCLQRSSETIDEIWPMRQDENGSGKGPYYASYLTFRCGDQWGIIDEDFNIVVYPASDYRGIVCGMNEIHIDAWPVPINKTIKLKDGYTIADGGHCGGWAEVYVYDIDKDAVFLALPDYDTVELTPARDVKKATSDAMPPVVRMQYVKQIEENGNIALEYYGYGFCDRRGNVLTTEQYDYADCFSGGVAAVYKNGKWGYVNEQMQNVTGFKYSGCYETRYDAYGDGVTPGYAYAAVNGRIAVCDDSGKFGIISTAGRQILPCEYDSIVPLANGNFFIKSGGEWEIKIF